MSSSEHSRLRKPSLEQADAVLQSVVKMKKLHETCASPSATSYLILFIMVPWSYFHVPRQHRGGPGQGPQNSTTFKLPKRELQHAVFIHLLGWAGPPSLLHAPVQQLSALLLQLWTKMKGTCDCQVCLFEDCLDSSALAYFWNDITWQKKADYIQSWGNTGKKEKN